MGMPLCSRHPRPDRAGEVERRVQVEAVFCTLHAPNPAPRLRPAAQNKLRRGPPRAQQHTTKAQPANHQGTQWADFATGRKRNRRGHLPDCPGQARIFPTPGIKWPGEGSNWALVLCKKRLDSEVASALKTEQVRYSRRPPGLSNSHSAQNRRCSCASCATSDSRRNQRTSGWRRTMPRRCKARPARWRQGVPPHCDCHQSWGRDASATSTCADKPSRASVSWMRALRFHPPPAP